MKKAKTNSLLIVMVAGIWGIVIYRIIAGMSANNTAEIINSTPDNIPISNYKQQNDSFKISYYSRDPFLGKQIQKPIEKPKTKSDKIQKIPEVKPEVPRPTVKYLGMIKNNSNSKQMALMSIDGQQKRMSPGDATQSVKLLTIYKDSCLIAFGKDKLIVKK